MILKKYNSKVFIEKSILEKYAMDTIAYFDIETTGFDKENDRICIISLGYFNKDGSFSINQYFAEALEEEFMILSAFLKDLSGFLRWCSFNGLAFDEPFILKKLAFYNIKPLIPIEHIDLYRLIKPYHKELEINSCSLKAIEKYLAIDRLDTIHGGESVELYKNYLMNRNNEILKTLLLHNYEDVLNLPILFNIINRIDSDENIIRENSITPNQLSYLNFLFSKHHIEVLINMNKISRKCAMRVIDAILKGNYNCSEITNVIIRNY